MVSGLAFAPNRFIVWEAINRGFSGWSVGGYAKDNLTAKLPFPAF